MKNRFFIAGLMLSANLTLFAQQQAVVTIHTDQAEQIIPKEIYGQFAEHLGIALAGRMFCR